MAKKKIEKIKKTIKKTKKIKYDESPEVPLEKITEEYEDLGRLNETSLIRRYKAIYKGLIRHKKMARMEEIQAFAICKLIRENNTNLLTLIENKFRIKFLS